LLAFGIEKAGARVILAFSAQAKQPFFPITPSGKYFDETVRWDSLQGATFLFSTEYMLAINARNVPANWKPMPPAMAPQLKLQMVGKGQDAWLNVVTEGYIANWNPIFTSRTIPNWATPMMHYTLAKRHFPFFLPKTTKKAVSACAAWKVRCSTAICAGR
jgi:hypothetical protein